MSTIRPRHKTIITVHLLLPYHQTDTANEGVSYGQLNNNSLYLALIKSLPQPWVFFHFNFWYRWWMHMHNKDNLTQRFKQANGFFCYQRARWRFFLNFSYPWQIVAKLHNYSKKYVVLLFMKHKRLSHRLCKNKTRSITLALNHTGTWLERSNVMICEFG